MSRRLSFRALPSSVEKLVVLAKANGWVNAAGMPNISRAINYVLEKLDVSKERRQLSGRKKRRKK